MEQKVTEWVNKNIPKQTGKVFLVTGANSGIGYEISHILAARGGQVIMAGRNHDKLTAAKAQILAELPAAELQTEIINLADLIQVAEAAAKIKESAQQIDVLINNAGIMATPYAKSKQGVEMQFAVNHLAHFLLTKELMPSLAKEGRVINMSSVAHLNARGNFQPHISEQEYSGFGVYSETKLANILFTYGLNKGMLNQQQVLSYVVHPGLSATNLFPIPKWLPGVTSLAKFLVEKTIGQSAAMGALGAIMTATLSAEELDEQKIYGPKLDEGANGIKGFPVASQPAATANAENTRKLWQLSERLLAEHL